MNTFGYDNAYAAPCYLRAGSDLIFSNAMPTAGGLAVLADYRTTDPYAPFHGRDGTNAWDDVVTPDVDTGTHDGASGVTVLHDSTKNWTPNLYVGMALRNTHVSGSNVTLYPNQMFGMISANTATSITCRVQTHSFNGVWWTNGQTFSITRVTNSFDSIGMGQSDLISGATPSPIQWANFAAQKCYQWSNSPHTTTYKFSAFENVRTNDHYIDWDSPAGYQPFTYPHPLIAVVNAIIATEVPPVSAVGIKDLFD